MREACYRAMGEALGQVEGLVDFNSWYQNELRGIMLSCLQVCCLNTWCSVLICKACAGSQHGTCYLPASVLFGMYSGMVKPSGELAGKCFLRLRGCLPYLQALTQLPTFSP